MTGDTRKAKGGATVSTKISYSSSISHIIGCVDTAYASDYFFFAVIMLKAQMSAHLNAALAVNYLTVSFLDPARSSELVVVPKIRMALNPRMSILCPEAWRNVCCA